MTVENLSKIYDKEYFQSELRNLENPKIIHHGSIVIVKDILKGRRKILDLGCGIGVLSKYLADSGKEVWGVDGSEYAISWAKDKYQGENLHFHLLDIERDKLPFPNKFFDGVLCLHTLEHLGNLDLFLEETKRVVADDGLVVFVVPNNGLGYRRLLMKILWGPLGRKEDSTHERSFTPSSFRKLVEQHFPSVEVFAYPAFLIWLVSPRLAKLLSFGLGNNIFAVCRL